jgi:glycosyltransferase involved in cell wall biosynthesis
MRIFMLVQPESSRGPVAKHTPHLVAALRSLGCTVVTYPWGRRGDEKRFLHNVTQRVRDVLSARQGLRGSEFDVAIVKTSHDWSTLARDVALALAVRRRCRPLLLQLHGSQSSKLVEPGHHAFKLATAVLLRLVDGVMVLSTEEQREWQAFRRRPGVFTVSNPYVRDAPSTSEAVESAGVVAPRVLFVGRLLEAKGILDLVEAFAGVAEHESCELVVVGDGVDEPRVRRDVQRLGVQNLVTLKGYLTGAELRREYEQATILALPTSWAEGFPTVLAEAMDAGLPIVTTRLRGAADHLVQGEHALFVEPSNVEEIAAAIVTLLRDPDLRHRMGAANRARVRAFDPAVVGIEYLGVLRSVVPGARGAVASSHAAA